MKCLFGCMVLLVMVGVLLVALGLVMGWSTLVLP